MVRKVFKYPVDINDVVRIQMPKGSEILSVGNQRDTLCIWALCDEKCSLEERTFRIAGTGHPINYDMGIDYKFLGTVHLFGSSLIFHVFEVL